MSDNPQFKRTDKAIMQAMISLLNRKPFEKITVQDILDETPVTRATFYAHYRDKYDIAERMLEHFLSVRGAVRKTLASPTRPSLEILERNIGLDNNFARALLKVHTEKVDFRKAITSELEKEYLETATGPYTQLQARIYAQAHAELYLSLLNEEFTDRSPEQVYQVFREVCLKLLNLDQDPQTRAFLDRKIAGKFNK